MIPSPRRRAVPPPVHQSSWNDLDDDDGWQDMPVVRSDENSLGLDEDDQRKYHYKPPVRLDSADTTSEAGPSTSNATGTHIELEGDTLLTDSWREKASLDESDYTRIRLDEDEESEEVHMRTRYLFDEEKAMTPLSQMQATKELLTEGQRIAYVGLCQLIARRMLRDIGRGWEGTKLKGKVMNIAKGKGKNEVACVESASIWMIKTMARLYQHMELAREEQLMIESLAEHGVDPSDLVPALMTTHTVKNPEFDPVARKQAELQKEKEQAAEADGEISDTETEAPPPYQPRSTGSASDVTESSSAHPLPPPSISPVPRHKSVNPFGDDDDDPLEFAAPPSASSSSSSLPLSIPPVPSLDADDDQGDIGRVSTPVKSRMPIEFEDDDGDIGRSSTPTRPSSSLETARSSSPSRPASPVAAPKPEEPIHDPEKTPQKVDAPLPGEDEGTVTTLPSLPGVSTSLTNADEMVTLDIRWTVLCDLFLVLIGDSIYDARSRHFLERIAEALGFGWLDVVRFENRVTDALEIQESVEKTEQGQIIEDRRKTALRKRYAMMGLAAVGGGLIIGLSAGLMAPFIGAGLGAALGTVGIGGTTGFLAGAGGAAVITTGGVLTGANIAGRGMARRTREVRTFELRPLHNNKRVACYITVGGFMSGKYDDVRLPFSVIDPIVGDVLSVFWEPEMMHEMGNALKILTSEVLTQVGQTVLQATVMAALMSALQWPIILTKLGYLIDNPWSNALDRARAAGLVLADTIINRHAGVRPVSLIGFSLGARTIFYALIELARQKAFGLVQDVFLFGTTVSASRQTWLEVRSAVAGRCVNGFATNDWMLGYLFRATSGGLNTVAGLRPVEVVAGLENVDVTDTITGHMSYRSCMPLLLAKVGFPVTAEHFDEPEDPDVDMTVQERTIVNEAEEKQKRGKILGIFPRREGSTTPADVGSQPNSRRVSGDKKDDQGEYELDDEDLPPREEDIAAASPTVHEQIKDQALKEKEEMEAIPATAGFDFKAISQALGKDIDVNNIKEPAAAFPPVPALPPLERSGSAPPEVKVDASHTGEPPMIRSASYVLPSPRDAEEDEGDITYLSTQSRKLSISDHTPSWDRPVISPSAGAISSSPDKHSSLNFGYNAWSAPAQGRTSPSPQPSAIPRAAPPARPHPPELMANPFASGFGSEKSTWGKRSKLEDMATGDQNPW